MTEKSFVVYTYHIFFSHLSVNGLLGHYHILTIVNSATVIMKVQKALQDTDFISFRYIPRSETIGSYLILRKASHEDLGEKNLR